MIYDKPKKIYYWSLGLVALCASIPNSSSFASVATFDMHDIAHIDSNKRVENTDQFFTHSLSDEGVVEYASQIEDLWREAKSEGVTIPSETSWRALGILASAPVRNPHISFGQDGDLTCQWSNGEKQLTLYVSSDNTWFVRSWGPHIFDDMRDGYVGEGNESSMEYLWAWLQS